MVSLFEEKDIREANLECESFKCLSPDGSNFKIIKAYWWTLKRDMKRFLLEFHSNGILPKGCNPTFITLIPRVDLLDKWPKKY